MGQLFSSSSNLAENTAQKEARTRRYECHETIKGSTWTEEPGTSTRDRMIQKRRRSRAPKVFTIPLDNRPEEVVERVCETVVGEMVQVFWTEINCWVDGEVVAYTNRMSETAMAGMHCIQYEDGIKEWKKIEKFRVVTQHGDWSKDPISSSSESAELGNRRKAATRVVLED